MFHFKLLWALIVPKTIDLIDRMDCLSSFLVDESERIILDKSKC